MNMWQSCRGFARPKFAGEGEKEITKVIASNLGQLIGGRVEHVAARGQFRRQMSGLLKVGGVF